VAGAGFEDDCLNRDSGLALRHILEALQMRHVKALVAFCVFFSALVHSQCDSKQDYRSAKNGGIVIEQMVLNGTQAFDSTEIAGITAQFISSCFDENAPQLSERLLDQLQQRGYFKAKVSNLNIKKLDPLASVKPAKVEAEVNEGPLYKLSEVSFVGNHAFTTEELKAKFPFKAGESFNSQKVRSGLQSLMHLYANQGYIDCTPIPVAAIPDSGGKVAVKISVSEGRQYRMGKLGIVGEPQTADLLKSRWSLAEGTVFDALYVDKFIEENKSLLPDDFHSYKSVLYTRDCKQQTMSLVLVLQAKPGFQPPPSKVYCETAEQSKPTS
jgi:outer membrane translocation and assembly module TamA